MKRQSTESRLIAELFVCGPVAMLLWSETAVLHGRGPSARQLMG
ncbi:hypothetical protein [Nocardia terrae]|nr:hypothetical protein [Nocardia terrae]